MPLVVKDRVRETTTTLGTGTVTLAGAVAGFQSFSAIGNANTTYYTINLPGANEWEVGIGTYTASGTTLSRDTILASSNSGSAVNFSAGTKDVFCTYPAGKSAYLDAANNLLIGTTTNTNTSNIVANGTISETVSGTQYLVASQYDVGTNPNQIPLNQYLGDMAFQSSAGVSVGALTASGAVTLSGGTANGVVYLNASKVATSGSALTFDGTNLGIGVAGSAPLSFANATGQKIRFYNALTGYGIGVESSEFRFVTDNSAVFTWGIGSYASPSEIMRLDSSGNLGLGVTPSAWGSNWKAMQLFFGFGPFSSNAGSTGLSGNCYNNNTNWIYSSTNPATRYEMGPDGGSHRWFTAPSGTANTTTITNGVSYIIITSGNQTAFGAANNNVGTSFTATSSGTLSSGTVSQNISFTQAMTLDASGRLLVGYTTTQSFNAALQVKRADATVGATTYTLAWFANATGYENGLAVKATDNVVTLAADFNGAAGGAAALVFATNSTGTANNATERARITSGGDFRVKGAGTAGSTDAFQISGSAPADAARLTSDGDFCVNTTAKVYEGRVSISFDGNGGTGDQGIALIDTNATLDGDYLLFANSAGNVAGKITHNGTTTVAYTTSSDYRLKEEVMPMTGALAKVAALKPVIYKWKSDGANGEGFIAHELQAICPDAVTGQKDAVDAEGKPVYQGIDTSFLVATLTAAIQEQQAMINELKAEVAALKGA